MERIATWGQRANESDPAYEAFKVYRNAGAQRSLRKAAREVGKSRSLIERWSRRHEWQNRIATWDLEQQDLRKEARFQAVSDHEERTGKLARAVLGRVAAELGVQHKGRCQTCGRGPAELKPATLATWLKAGVEVERLALGLSTAGAPQVTQTNVTQVQAGSTTTLVLIRDPETQRLASDLLGRMQVLDPATSLRRLGGGGNGGSSGAPPPAATSARLEEAGTAPTGRAAVRSARLEAERARHELEEAGPDRGDRSAMAELGIDGGELEEAEAEARADSDAAARASARYQRRRAREAGAEEEADDSDLF